MGIGIGHGGMVIARGGGGGGGGGGVGRGGARDWDEGGDWDEDGNWDGGGGDGGSGGGLGHDGGVYGAGRAARQVSQGEWGRAEPRFERGGETEEGGGIDEDEDQFFLPAEPRGIRYGSAERLEQEGRAREGRGGTGDLRGERSRAGGDGRGGGGGGVAVDGRARKNVIFPGISSPGRGRGREMDGEETLSRLVEDVTQQLRAITAGERAVNLREDLARLSNEVRAGTLPALI